jgi:hypothetical protein
MAQHDVITIDTGELRSAAAALRRAADDTIELGLRIPRDIWGAPEWLANPTLDEVTVVRRQVDELAADLRGEAEALDRRAADVDGAETRFWSIANGELRCGCVLPSGEIVATPLSGAVAAAWGPGIDGSLVVPVAVGAVGLAASGGVAVSTAGGGSTLGLAGDPDVQIVVPAPSAAPVIMTTSTTGGGGVMGLPGDPDVQIVVPAPSAAPVIMTTSTTGGGGVMGLPGDPDVQIVVPAPSAAPVIMTTSTTGGGGLGGGVTILQPTGGGARPGDVSITLPSGMDPGDLPKLIYDSKGNVVGMQTSGPVAPDGRPLTPLNIGVPHHGIPPLGPGTGNTIPGT